MNCFPRMNVANVSAFFVGLILIMIIGYVDYLTGVFSLDLFYLVVIFAVTWLAGVGCGMLCVLEAVGVEAAADYYSEMGKLFKVTFAWSWATDLIIFSVCCILIGVIRHLAAKSNDAA
jgi:hypothetical protein